MCPDAAAFDELAGDLLATDFDAVELEGLRAEWTDEGQRVAVRPVGGGEGVTYNGEDLVCATSAAQLRDARDPDAT